MEVFDPSLAQHCRQGKNQSALPRPLGIPKPKRGRVKMHVVLSAASPSLPIVVRRAADYSAPLAPYLFLQVLVVTDRPAWARI